MIINRSHLPWVVFILLGTLATGFLYVENFHVPSLHGKVGSTPLGLIYGTAALAIFIFAMLLNPRKKKPVWRLGSVRLWLEAHIWLTVFTIPLVLFHSDFKIGGGITSLLMLLYSVVMVSGFYGLALQQFIPRLMTEKLPEEVVFEEIPYLRRQLQESAAKLRESWKPKFRGRTGTGVAVARSATDQRADQAISTLTEFLDSQVSPYLHATSGRKFRLGDRRLSDDSFRLLKFSVAEPYRVHVDEMQKWCDNRRMMDLQTRLHLWLHGWLMVHVPMSILLLLLTGWHAVSALFFF